MTYELAFRTVHAIILTVGFVGLCRGTIGRWEFLTPRGRRQYVAFVFREFSVWLGIIYLAYAVPDPARQTILPTSYLVLAASLVVAFTAWFRTPGDEYVNRTKQRRTA